MSSSSLRSFTAKHSMRLLRCQERAAVYEAANVILTRPVKGSDLKGWALAVARRAGPKKARVALARKPLLRLANRSSADPIEQRQSADCRQKQALGEGLSSQGIDAKPATEDRIMYRQEPQRMTGLRPTRLSFDSL
ncbi:hypothetical protein BHMPCIPO_06466 [Ensifer sesbaniae]|nr:hypothetical protein [Ensifer sesbaniae]